MAKAEFTIEDFSKLSYAVGVFIGLAEQQPADVREYYLKQAREADAAREKLAGVVARMMLPRWNDSDPKART